jgi:murein DD-endopeptidase MepM/ murein hydrolase activator NlpD
VELKLILNDYNKFEMNQLRIFILLVFCTVSGIAAQNPPAESVIVLDQPGFPFIFELNQGESQTISRTYQGKTLKRTVTLESIKPITETNLWFDDGTTGKDYFQVDLGVKVSGTKATIHHRPYQMPEIVNGLRINVENVNEWDAHGKLGSTGDMKKQVRFAVCLENEPWGPEKIVFPINNYRWRAAVYNNTWSGLVPFNLLYYHRGEDYGAIPDLLDVVSTIDGKIVSTPVPEGVKRSNSVVIDSPDGIRFIFAHMNYENIVKEYTKGTEVKSGTLLGKTGMTWDGKKSQFSDPHLHVELRVKGVNVASFPYLMEAYLRKYPDQAIAIAGGYRFAVPGEKVELDAPRSFARNRLPLEKVTWKLSDGRTVNTPMTSISYSKPGIYSEELIVQTKEGSQDRDFLYVTVFDPVKKRDMAYGWAYYYPVRGIKPGDKVLFWNRNGTSADTMIDYGDDSPEENIQKEANHSYMNSGRYVVTLTSTGPNNEPLTLKMEVVVE